MKLEDFTRIDPNNLGSAPWAVKSVILAVLFGVIIALGYWFSWQPEYEALDVASQKEAELRDIFVKKKSEAIQLPAYKQQMADIERTFGALLRQLPNKSEMDALLSDINQAGLEQGLEFELFKPGQEKPADFYAEMPVNIKVTGGYVQLGAFAYSISKLSRIVTLNDLKITPVTIKEKGKEETRLSLDAVAKTFRYLDTGEIKG